jgi:DNA polymerase-3 subunit epsilon
LRSRTWRDAPFTALDFETTGLDYSRDTIVSFGTVPVVAGRVVVGDAVHQLVDPHVPPSVSSQRIHELRPQDLAGAPRLEEAREILGRAIEGRFLLVWFAEVEINFLSAIFGGAPRGWGRRCIDVRSLAISADRLPRSARGEPGFALGQTADRYGVPVANPHEALDDALVTAQLFIVLAGRRTDGRPPTVRDLLRAASPSATRTPWSGGGGPWGRARA